VLPAGERLIVRNSVIAGALAVAVAPETGSAEVVFDRCVVWAPGGTCLWNDRGHPSFRASGTLFEGSDALLVSYAGYLAGWRGERNVYRLGRHAWLIPQERPSAGLAAWRETWNEPEEGSQEGEPMVYDPFAWKSLSSGAGFRAAPGGVDAGADVRRVARTARPE
jgi:hypothetical protein